MGTIDDRADIIVPELEEPFILQTDASSVRFRCRFNANYRK